MTTQTDVLRRFLGGRPAAARVAAGAERIVAVGAGKGGTGTSIVAALAALGAATDGARTLLVDTDTDVGTLHRLLGVAPHVPLGALRASGAAPDDVVVPVTDRLDLVAGGGGDAALPDVERRALLKRVAPLFDRYDLVVLDAGSRLDGMLRALSAGAGRLVVVTMPDPIAVAASYALVKAVEARQPGVPIALVVHRDDGPAAQRAADEFAAGAARFLARDVPCEALVPEDPSLRAALGAGMPLFDAAAGSPAATLLGALGTRLREAPVSPARPLAARTA